MVTADFISLLGILITAVIGPFILAKQKSNDKKANQSADIHVSNAQVLSALVGAVEALHTKVDVIGERPCVGSSQASEVLGRQLHELQSDIAVLKDRGGR